MQDELIEEVDWNDNVVRVRPKTDLKQAQFPHRGAIIIPQTPDGRIILCRRAKTKHPFPDVWCAAVGGHVRAGETYDEAALREMQEEVGFVRELIHVATLAQNLQHEQVIHHIYTLQKPVEISAFHPNPEEIQYLQAFTSEEITRMINEKPLQFALTFINVFRAFQEQYLMKP